MRIVYKKLLLLSLFSLVVFGMNVVHSQRPVGPSWKVNGQDEIIIIPESPEGIDDSYSFERGADQLLYDLPGFSGGNIAEDKALEFKILKDGTVYAAGLFGGQNSTSIDDRIVKFINGSPNSGYDEVPEIDMADYDCSNWQLEVHKYYDAGSNAGQTIKKKTFDIFLGGVIGMKLRGNQYNGEYGEYFGGDKQIQMCWHDTKEIFYDAVSGKESVNCIDHSWSVNWSTDGSGASIGKSSGRITVNPGANDESFHVYGNLNSNYTGYSRTYQIMTKVTTKPHDITSWYNPINTEISTFGIWYDYRVDGYPENATGVEFEITPSEAVNDVDRSAYQAGIRIKWDSNYAGEAKVKVRGRNKCGGGDWFVENIQINGTPPQCTEPTGPSNPCANGQPVSYETNSAGASQFEWSFSPSEAGTITENGDVCEVDYNSDYKGEAYLKVRSANQYGNFGEWSPTLTINVDNVPGKVNKPVGTDEICQDYGVNEYTVSSQNNTDTYNWKVYPSDAADISGTSEVAQFDWNSQYHGVAFVFVEGENSCGLAEPSDSLEVNVKAFPQVPEYISGKDTICNTSVEEYITEIDYADTYNWSLNPSDAGSVYDNGNDTVEVSISEDYTGNIDLSVYGGNECKSQGQSISKEIYVQGVHQPGQIPIGDYDVCQNDTNAFEIYSVDRAISYEWKVRPEFAYDTIIADDTLAFVDWVDSYSGNAYVSFRVENNCGIGSYSEEREVTVNSVPGKASKPVGETSVCQSNDNINYSTGGSSNSNGYEWKMIPDTAAEYSSNSSEVSINFKNDYVGQVRLMVRGVNDCGFGKWSDTLDIVVNPLPQRATIDVNNSVVCQGNSSIFVSNAEYADTYNYNMSSDVGEMVSYADTLEIHWNKDYSGDVEIKTQGVNGCGAGQWSDNVIVSVKPLPDVSLSLGNENYCPYDNADKLTGGSPSGGNYLLEGNVVDSIIPEDMNTGRYNVVYKYTDEFGCLNDASSSVYIDEIKAAFSSNVQKIDEGQRVEFTSNSVNASDFVWDFGDGSENMKEENPEHYYYEDGSYDVSLKAISNIGCVDSLDKEDYIVVVGESDNDDSTETAINSPGQSRIRVYPNPVDNSRLVVKVNNYENQELFYKLYDLSGTKVKEGVIFDRKKTILLDNLQKGVYLMKVKGEGKYYVTKRIIKL